MSLRTADNRVLDLTAFRKRAYSRSAIAYSSLKSTMRMAGLTDPPRFTTDKKRKRLQSDGVETSSASHRARLGMPEQSVQCQERGNREPSQDAEGIEGINSSDDTLIEVAQEVLDDSEDHQLLLAGDRFWFEDGNVILVAGDTRFRVYQGLLAAQSSVLAHIFSSTSQLVNTPTSEEIISDLGDPCLVVHLSDSPEDLRHMLRLFMPR